MKKYPLLLLLIAASFSIKAQTVTTTANALSARNTAAPASCTPGRVYAEYVSGAIALKQCNPGGASYVTFSSSSIGVASVTGTANQITASSATGVVTLSLPSSVVIQALTNTRIMSGASSTDLGLDFQVSHTTDGYIGAFRRLGGTNNPGLYVTLDEATSRAGIRATGSSGSLELTLGGGGVDTFVISSTSMAPATAGGASIGRSGVPVSGVWTQTVNATDNISIATAGKTLQIKTGTNACSGSATLSAGTATVSTTCTGTTWGTDFIIQLTSRGSSVGVNRVSTHTAATSFVITSTDVTSTDQVGWTIIKLN